MRSPHALGLATAVALFASGSSAGGLPQTRLGYLEPPGGQAGTTFEVRVAAEENLDYESLPGLIFTHPGISAQAVTDAESGRWRDKAFRVTIARDVPPGRYDVMLDGHYGASNPRPFHVEADRTLVEVAETGSESAIPVDGDEVLYGRIDRAADVDAVTFRCEAAQTFVVLCDADRIGSPLQPVVELTGPGGRILGTAGGPYSGRAVLAVTPKIAGEYVLRVTDAAYRGGPNFAYRLSVTTRPIVAYAWPPALASGQTASVELYGYNLPEAEIVEDGFPLVHHVVEVVAPPDSGSFPKSEALAPSQAVVGGFDYAIGDGRSAAGSVPIFHSPLPLVAEVEPNDRHDPAVVAVPADIAGRFERRADIDRFAFEAKKGEVLVLEAFAERYGSPADPVLTVERLPRTSGQAFQPIVVQDDHAENLGTGVFDATTRDPIVRFEAPEDGRYEVAIRDRFGTSRGGRDLTYHLSLRQPRPDFRLAVVPFFRSKPGDPPAAVSPVLRRGENVSVTVFAIRRDGFDGPIDLQVEGLPAGVAASPSVIGPGLAAAPLVFSAAEDAVPWRGQVRIFGESMIDSGRVRREAAAGTINGDGTGSLVGTRLGGELLLSVVDEQAPFRLTGEGGQRTVAAGSQVVLSLRRAGMNAASPESVTVAADSPGDGMVSVEVKPFAAGQSEQLVRLVISPKAPARSHLIAFNGTGQIEHAGFAHRLRRAKREQEAAADRFTQAEQALKLATSVHGDAMKAIAEAERIKAEAERAAVDAASVVGQRRTEVTTGETVVAAARAAVTSLDGDAVKALATRSTELEQAHERLTIARQAEGTAAKRAVEAATVLEAAKAALRDRENALKTAEEVRKREEAAKKGADQSAAEAEKAARQKIEYMSPAPPLTLTVVPALAVLTAEVPDGGSLKCGATLDVKVAAKRTDGFTGAIFLALTTPAGPAGITAEPVSIASDRTEAVLRITAANDAAEGEVVFPAIRATFDSPDSAPLDLPLSLKVVP